MLLNKYTPNLPVVRPFVHRSPHPANLHTSTRHQPRQDNEFDLFSPIICLSQSVRMTTPFAAPTRICLHVHMNVGVCNREVPMSGRNQAVDVPGWELFVFAYFPPAPIKVINRNAFFFRRHTCVAWRLGSFVTKNNWINDAPYSQSIGWTWCFWDERHQQMGHGRVFPR